MLGCSIDSALANKRKRNEPSRDNYTYIDTYTPNLHTYTIEKERGRHVRAMSRGIIMGVLPDVSN